MSKSTKPARHVRIIGGEFKRQFVYFYDVEGLRPTPDRVRETVFNWLMWETQGKTVLDLCAGSGVMGIEALSRGASHCTFIEPDRKQAEWLKQQLQQLKVHPDRYRILNMTAEQAAPQLQKEAISFDLLILDPPYSKNLWQELSALYDTMIVANGLIYVEADRPQNELGLPNHWQQKKQGRAGQIYFSIYNK